MPRVPRAIITVPQTMILVDRPPVSAPPLSGPSSPKSGPSSTIAPPQPTPLPAILTTVPYPPSSSINSCKKHSRGRVMREPNSPPLLRARAQNRTRGTRHANGRPLGTLRHAISLSEVARFEADGLFVPNHANVRIVDLMRAIRVGHGAARVQAGRSRFARGIGHHRARRSGATSRGA